MYAQNALLSIQSLVQMSSTHFFYSLPFLSFVLTCWAFDCGFFVLNHVYFENVYFIFCYVILLSRWRFTVPFTQSKPIQAQFICRLLHQKLRSTHCTRHISRHWTKWMFGMPTCSVFGMQYLWYELNALQCSWSSSPFQCTEKLFLWIIFFYFFFFPSRFFFGLFQFFRYVGRLCVME